MEQYIRKINLYFELKGLPESTKVSYGNSMKLFLTFTENQDKSIDELNVEDIQHFILYLKNERGLSPGTINNYISAIKFFWTYVLEKEWDALKIPRMKRTKKFPAIPSKEEVLLLINGTDNLKHKAILLLMYGSGLRVGEVAKLKIGDICSKTMRVRVDNAKHNTNRYTILSTTALQVLREYFKVYFSNVTYTRDDWLFPGANKEKPIHVRSIKKTVIKLRNKTGVDSHISAHTLRHCFSTHSLEDGVDPVFIQQMLGHKRLQTTLSYLHTTSKSLMGVKSPLDSKGDQAE